LAPRSVHLAPIVHQPGGIKTEYDRDPFHYSGMKSERWENWQICQSNSSANGIIRTAQQMLAFSMRIENGTGGLRLGYVPVDVGRSLLSVGISARLPGKRLLVAAPDRGPGLEQSA